MGKFQKVNLDDYEKPSKFLKLKAGENRIRILAEPYIYQVVGKMTKTGFTRYILDDKEPTPEFFQDLEPKTVYGFIVYSQDASEFKILEASAGLGHNLTELVKSKHPEEYKAFDILITAEGEGLKRRYELPLFAKDTKPLPKGLNNLSPEYKAVATYFEGL